jgi:hypothetical protein
VKLNRTNTININGIIFLSAKNRQKKKSVVIKFNKSPNLTPIYKISILNLSTIETKYCPILKNKEFQNSYIKFAAIAPIIIPRHKSKRLKKYNSLFKIKQLNTNKN